MNDRANSANHQKHATPAAEAAEHAHSGANVDGGPTIVSGIELANLLANAARELFETLKLPPAPTDGRCACGQIEGTNQFRSDGQAWQITSFGYNQHVDTKWVPVGEVVDEVPGPAWVAMTAGLSDFDYGVGAFLTCLHCEAAYSITESEQYWV